MRINRSLLDDLERIYFSIPCTSGVSCEHCKNENICKTLCKVLLSIRKFY